VKTSETTQAPRECLDGCFDALSSGVLEVPWVLDVDVTVKPPYGKQEGANPDAWSSIGAPTTAKEPPQK